MPAATVQPVGRLRPPDLIIQDELHLITGALGTTVGLFEAAVDDAVRRGRPPDGTPVRPMIVASTATVRNAPEQVRGLFGAAGRVFPPQVLDVARHVLLPGGAGRPTRRPAGGTSASARTACGCKSRRSGSPRSCCSAGQLLFDRHGAAADPYMTLVGYFNATRELAGMRRYLDDDVQNRVKRPRKDSGLPAAASALRSAC